MMIPRAWRLDAGDLVAIALVLAIAFALGVVWLRLTPESEKPRIENRGELIWDCVTVAKTGRELVWDCVSVKR